MDNQSNEELIAVETIPQFAAMIAAWHANLLQRFKHLVEIPAGTEVSITEGVVEKTIKLEGDVLTGFKAALYTVLDELKDLPFGAMQDDADPSDD